MPKGDIETYFEGGRWKNQVEGSSSAANSFDTKEEAQANGREIVWKRKVEHIIRKQDGSIGSRNTYGSDPRDIPG